jgi:hypothetical protein
LYKFTSTLEHSIANGVKSYNKRSSNFIAPINHNKLS